MCSVEEDIEDLSQSFRKKQTDTAKGYSLSGCKKCGDKSILLLQKKDPFCRKCFFEYCDHKFRSTIGKTKKIKHGQRVLLACSGGQKSTALLHMTKQALESASVKQISFVPGILFIDESAVAPSSVTNMKPQVCEILKELKRYGYPIFYSSLEMVYKINDNCEFYWPLESCDLPQDLPICSDSQNWIKECTAEMSLSAKLDFIKHLRLLLMTEIASCAEYDYLFVGDSASSLAVDLLNDISFGRGSQISSDTNFCDSRYKVPVCRPIREFLGKEIALYNHLHNCSYTVLPDLLTKTDAKLSVQRLTESFISGLQQDFPATVFTIFRTGGKLSKHNTILEAETCLLCMSKLDNLQPEACSALEALKLSQELSQMSKAGSNLNVSVKTNSSADTCLTKSKDFEMMNVSKYLCHGCSIPFRYNKKNMSFFPFILKRNCVQMERHEIKEEIKDFLIKEEEAS